MIIDKLSLEFEIECIYSYAWNDDGLSYKKRVSDIYSYIKNNNKTELMDKFYQVYFAYQELGSKYLNMVAIPDFYLKNVKHLFLYKPQRNFITISSLSVNVFNKFSAAFFTQLSRLPAHLSKDVHFAAQ